MRSGSLQQRFAVIIAILLWLLSAWSYAANPPALDNGAVNLRNWSPQQSPAIKLSGNWRFFPGQLITPRQLLANPSAFKRQATPLKVPASWNTRVGSNGLPKGHGTGTYWISFTGGKPPVPVSLAINRACSNANIYFFPDNRPSTAPIATLGTVASSAALATPYAGSALVSLPFTNSQVHHLLIQVSNFNFLSGGLCGQVRFGATDFLQHLHEKHISNESMLIAMIGMAALYLFALMTQPRNRNPRAFWLTTLCVSASLFFLSSSGLLEALILSQRRWVYELRIDLTFLGLTWSSASLLMFYARCYPHYVKRTILAGALSASGICSGFILLAPTAWVTTLSPAFLVYWGIQVFLGIAILGIATYRRHPYSLPMLVAVIPLMLAIPYDVYRGVVLNEMPVFSLSGLLFFIFVHSLLIGRRISEAIDLAEKLSRNLKKEVNIRTAALNDKNLKLTETQRELEEANEALKKLSITDGLTGIYNRMYFEQEIRKEWRRGARLHKPMSVLMIDVDHFKQLNDSAGHLAGDQALRNIAGALHQHFKRAGDLVARYGGEEFIVMLPNTDQRIGLAIAEAVRVRIENLPFSYNAVLYKTTVSIGISTATPSHKLSPDTLLATADSALYQAKNAGRNRVESIPLLPAATYDDQRSQQS